MGLILLAAVGAFVVLRPRSYTAVLPGKNLAGVNSLLTGGRPLTALQDNMAPFPDDLTEQVCGAVAAGVVKATGGSDALAAKAGSMSPIITNPVCAVNLYALEYGVHEGAQAYEYISDKVSGGYQTVKGLF